MESKERLVAWWRESVKNIRRDKWWLVFVPIVLWFLGGLAEDRFFHAVNAYLDAHAPAFIAQLRAIITFRGRFALAGIGIAAVLLVSIVRAYMNTQPGIVGTVDLMVQNLEIPDLQFSGDGISYTMDLAVFARMEVASVDKPRTVTRFEIEMTAPDNTCYHARSEYELGKYDHKYDVSARNDWGLTSVRSVREPMEDLAAKVRVPMQPYTHVSRAWVRFELKAVKQGHEPKNCKTRIWAVDPSGRRHEITADGVKVRSIEDKEYAVAKKA
jgi:hypothetical protein